MLAVNNIADAVVLNDGAHLLLATVAEHGLRPLAFVVRDLPGDGEHGKVGDYLAILSRFPDMVMGSFANGCSGMFLTYVSDHLVNNGLLVQRREFSVGTLVDKEFSLPFSKMVSILDCQYAAVLQIPEYGKNGARDWAKLPFYVSGICCIG